MFKKLNEIEKTILKETKKVQRFNQISSKDLEELAKKIKEIRQIGAKTNVLLSLDFIKDLNVLLYKLESNSMSNKNLEKANKLIEKANNIKVNEALIASGILKKHKLSKKTKVVMATGITTFALAAGVLVYAYNGGFSKTKTTEETPVKKVSTNEIVSSNQAVEYTAMSEKTLALTKDINLSIDEALSKGLLSNEDVLLEADKAVYADAFTKYSIFVNSDSYTNLEWATLFGEGIDPTEELIENLFNVNTSIKKHLIVVKSDNVLDYSKLGFKNEKSAALLTDSERLIARLNETTGSERKQAAKDWYAFATEFLATTDGDVNYDEFTLDLLVTQSEAFDELTRSYGYGLGASIDDELEHALNTAKENCINYLSGTKTDSNIKVEDYGIENEKSVLRIKMVEKGNARYAAAINERDLQIILGNELNEYDSFENIVKTVEENIDLSLYVKMDDYVAAQLEAKGITKDGKPAGAVIDATDSLISNGVGSGDLSDAQVAKYGDTPAEVQAGVQADFEQQAEANAVIDFNTKNAAIQKGAADANNGLALNKSSVATELEQYYTDGYNAAKAEKAKAKAEADAKAADNATNFVDTDDVVENKTTSQELVTDYTGDTKAAIADGVNTETTTSYETVSQNILNAEPSVLEVKTLTNTTNTKELTAIESLKELKIQYVMAQAALAEVMAKTLTK